MTDPRPNLTITPPATVADPTTVPAVWWRLEDLDPWQENPRVYSREAVTSLADLIQRHGFNTVIGGHWPTRRIVRGHRRHPADRVHDHPLGGPMKPPALHGSGGQRP